MLIVVLSTFFYSVLFINLIVSCNSWIVLYFLYPAHLIHVLAVNFFNLRLSINGLCDLTFLCSIIALEVLICNLLHSNFSYKNTHTKSISNGLTRYVFVRYKAHLFTIFFPASVKLAKIVSLQPLVSILTIIIPLICYIDDLSRSHIFFPASYRLTFHFWFDVLKILGYFYEFILFVFS